MRRDGDNTVRLSVAAGCRFVRALLGLAGVGVGFEAVLLCRVQNHYRKFTEALIKLAH